MKPFGLLRIASRSTAVLKYNQFPLPPRASLNARRLSTTPRRPFVDECLLQTHVFINGVHDMTGLPWAATIPLLAFLVRLVVVFPAQAYALRVYRKQLKLYPQLKEAKVTIEKEVRQKHGDKSPQERQRIQDRIISLLWAQMVKRDRAQGWRSRVVRINIPLWFVMMETIRRMTGTEDGMLSLTAKSLTVLQGKQCTVPGTMDAVVPMDPSLSTEGMLWFDNLMLPDPLNILPFVLSGMIYVMFTTRRGIIGYTPLPGQEEVTQSLNRRKNRALKLAALVIGPATLMFPSAMLLYWFSSSLAAVTVGYLQQILPRIRFIRVTRSPDKKKTDEDKRGSKPKMQEFRGPTMQDLRSRKKKEKKK